MYYYRLYDLRICSNIPIRQLIAIDKDEIDVEIRAGEIPKDLEEEYRTHHLLDFIDKERLWFTNSKGMFVVEQGKRIWAKVYPGVEDYFVIPYILGFAMAFLAYQRDIIALHGSVFRYAGLGIVVTGRSGSGKSTLTTRFLELGASLMSDDVSWINDQGIALPAYPQQNLCRDAIDSYKIPKEKCLPIIYNTEREKMAVSREECFCKIPKKIDIFVEISVENRQDVWVEPIRGSDKLKVLLNQLFLRYVFERYGYPPEQKLFILKVAQHLDIYRIHRPKIGDSTKEQIIDLMSRVKKNKGIP